MIVLPYDYKKLELIAREVAKFLRQGKVFAIPTDTSYGLIADATNVEAVKRVFNIKKRPYEKPLSIFVSDINFALRYIRLTDLAKKALKLFPGPYTIIFRAQPSDLVKKLIVHNETVGIRISQFELPRVVVKHLGRPITATSANIHGKPPIYNSEELWSLNIDGIVDAKILPLRPVSTIIDVSSGNCVKILRVGAVDINRLIGVLNKAGIYEICRDNNY